MLQVAEEEEGVMRKRAIATLAGTQRNTAAPVAPGSLHCCSQLTSWLLGSLALECQGICWAWMTQRSRVAEGGQRDGRRDGILPWEDLQQDGHS